MMETSSTDRLLISLVVVSVLEASQLGNQRCLDLPAVVL